MEGCKLILDSGERREFASGAVRDVQEGKGRADLLPLDVAADLLDRAEDLEQDNGIHPLLSLSYFMGHTADKEYVYNAIKEFSRRNGWNTYTMLLEVSKHFEEGAKKYGARNWEKGISAHCYIDSAVRHYIKWARGDTDEPHDRAFCWNLMCLVWTLYHRPECNDLGRENA